MTADDGIWTLVDQAARDRIVHDLDVTLFVEAGAGTGKTRSLVDRIVRLLATGRTAAPALAAITFTEAAAAELRDRVRDSLEQLVADPATPGDERARGEAALDDLDAAALETIHSFCRRLLAAYPLEAGLPPIFEVLDETEAPVFFGDVWDEWLRDWLHRAESDPALGLPLLRSFALGLKTDDLQQIARSLAQHWDRMEGVPFATPPQPTLSLDDLATELDRLLRLRAECLDPEDKLLKHLDRLEQHLVRLHHAADEMEQVVALARLDRLTTRGGQQANWRGVQPGVIRDALADMQGRRDAIFNEMCGAAADALLAEISRFVLEAADRRCRLGRLEFHDLLVLARDLLRRAPTVRQALCAHYTHLLIDEFQDTDPLQAEIALLLGASVTGEPYGDEPGAERGKRLWLQSPIEPGRLFFVGDPKQSIYRFRRADITLYHRVQARFGSSGQDTGSVVRLTQNFRSVPGVIDWVNAQFQARFDADTTGHQAVYEPLTAARPALTGRPAVRRVGGPLPAAAEGVRAEEAPVLVALIQRIRQEGWLVQREGETVPARLSDIAVLAPTRRGLEALIRALEEAAIPHRLESRSLVYDAPEVRDLIAILRAIDDPTDEVALIAALRSPGFACADDDLARHAAAGGRWDHRYPLPPEPPGGHAEGLPPDLRAQVQAGPVVAGLSWLREQHAQRWWRPLPALLGDVIRERRLLELAFVDQRPRERWQRLRFVAEQARAYAERPEATLRGLIDWLRRQADEHAQVLDWVVPEHDDDAVRVMTVHASKGLQFPIVILAGLNVGAPHPPGVRVLWPEDASPEISIGKQLRSSGYEDASSADQALEQLERERLLYVAATRAQDHLVLSLFHSEPKPGANGASRARRTHAAELHRWAEDHPELCPVLPLDGTLDIPPPLSPDTPVEQPGDREAWLAARETLISARAYAPAVSATGLAKAMASRREESDPVLDASEPEDEVPPWRRGRAGTAMGRAVHSTLQTVNLASADGLEAIAAAQATAEGVPGRAAEVARLARAALESPPVREAVQHRYWREVYVAAEVDGIVVDGFIDLLYEAADGYVIVDYKTDVIQDAAGLDAALERYRPQAAAYALALAGRLPRPVVRCLFVFAAAPSETGGAAVRAVESLAQAIEDARRALPAVLLTAE